MRLPQISGRVWFTYLLIGLVLEAVAVFNGLSTGDTISEIVERTFPGWIVYTFLGWLVWHFRKMR